VKHVVGLEHGSDWTYLVQRPPASKLLAYIFEKWLEYEAHYSGIGEPFEQRSESKLTQGLATYLMKQSEAKKQPFDGEFFAELNRYDLRPDGKCKIVGRTDIEWRLFGSPNFTVEFKVIGGGRPAKAYVADGMVRFVDGRYSPDGTEGAMWAFFRPGSSEVASDLEAIIDKHLGPLGCQPEKGVYRIAPSVVAPDTAKFDSLHLRKTKSVIRLAHVFVTIAPSPKPK